MVRICEITEPDDLDRRVAFAQKKPICCNDGLHFPSSLSDGQCIYQGRQLACPMVSVYIKAGSGVPARSPAISQQRELQAWARDMHLTLCRGTQIAQLQWLAQIDYTCNSFTQSNIKQNKPIQY